jgi:hypothetical protein
MYDVGIHANHVTLARNRPTRRTSGRRPTVTDPGGNTGTRSTANTYNRETGRVTQGATVPDGKTCTAEITAQGAVTASG